MHIVSTLLSRLLFLTICIFNVNIYSIYHTVCVFFFFLFRCFRVTTHEGQVSYQGCSLLKRCVFLREFRSFYSISNAPAGAVPPQGETVVRQRRRTDTALATYRNETIQALSTPRPQTPPPAVTVSQVALKGSLCVSLRAARRKGGAGLPVRSPVLSRADGM